MREGVRKRSKYEGISSGEEGRRKIPKCEGRSSG